MAYIRDIQMGCIDDATEVSFSVNDICDCIEKAKKLMDIIGYQREIEQYEQFDFLLQKIIGETALFTWFEINGMPNIDSDKLRTYFHKKDNSICHWHTSGEKKIAASFLPINLMAPIPTCREDIRLPKKMYMDNKSSANFFMQIYYCFPRLQYTYRLAEIDFARESALSIYNKVGELYKEFDFYFGWIDKPTLEQELKLNKHYQYSTFQRGGVDFMKCKIITVERAIIESLRDHKQRKTRSYKAREIHSGRKQVEKRRVKRKNRLFWTLFVAWGLGTSYCFIHKIIPFFVIGVILMLGNTLLLLRDDDIYLKKGNLNAILLIVFSLIGIGLFWYFHMWWWMIGLIAYLIYVVFLTL